VLVRGGRRFHSILLEKWKAWGGSVESGRCCSCLRAFFYRSRNIRISVNRNITLSLDEEVLAEARVIAAKNGLSVSALLRRELMRLVEAEGGYVKARESALRRLKAGHHLGGGPLPDREELHDRA
jgi:hypothetical protein